MRVRLLLLAFVLVLGGCGSVIEESADTDSSADETVRSCSENPTDAPTSEPEESSDGESHDGAIDTFGILPEDELESGSPPSSEALGNEERDVPDSDSESDGEPPMGAALSGLPSDPDNPGFRIGPTFSTDDGTFHRLIMADDYDRIADPVIINQEELTVPADELHDALVFTGRFAAEELATSELAFDYTDDGADAWFEDHEDSFVHPDRARAGLLSSDNPRQSLALLYTDNGWNRGVPEHPARVQDLAVQVVSVEQDGPQLLISHLVTFNADVSGTADLSGTFTEKTRVHATYTVEQVDGEWKIADYETSWDTRY